jgi:hypothetical protein
VDHDRREAGASRHGVSFARGTAGSTAESRSARQHCSEEGPQREETKRKEGDVAERLIGYLVSLAVLAGMGIVLPRWFEWRRSLINGLPRERKGAGHV